LKSKPSEQLIHCIENLKTGCRKSHRYLLIFESTLITAAIEALKPLLGSFRAELCRREYRFASEIAGNRAKFRETGFII
jgi:hypothetical protein